MPDNLDSLTPLTLKVLEFFFTDSRAEFHEREVIRRANISKGSANKILRRLAALDLLIRTKKGRMVFYALNESDPRIKQLKILNNVWTLHDFVSDNKDRMRKMILFGSSADGTDIGESDYDILILTDQKTSLKESISRFNRNSSRKISPIALDMNEFVKMKREDRSLFERIDRGIVLWETA
jgi:predicted nucleotidyltransferase/predicted transcriptional regulator